MKAIRKQRNGYAILFTLNLCFTVWFATKPMPKMFAAFVTISITSFIFFVRQNRLLYDASLIWDNRILVVLSAIIFTAANKEKDGTQETVVSTFGIFIGTQVYRWGRDGIHGVRLKAIAIERERMYLTFGDTTHTMRVELLHGMAEQQKVLDVAEKLWSETGVKASISGWN